MHATRITAIQTILVIGFLMVGSGTAWSKSNETVDGKTIKQWLKELKRKKESRVEDAIEALGHFRFTVGAAEEVLPKLMPFLSSRNDEHFRAARTSVQRYGHVARAVLCPDGQWPHRLSRKPTIDYLSIPLFFALVGNSREVRKALEEMPAAYDIDIAQTMKYSSGADRNHMVTLWRVASLGLRGASMGRFVYGKVRATPETYMLDLSNILSVANRLGPASCDGLVRMALDRVNSKKEKILTQRALGAVVWNNEYSGELKKALSVGVKVGKKNGFSTRTIRGLMLTPHSDKATVIDYLRAASKTSNRVASTWAIAGLARLAPDPKSQVGLLTQLLANKSIYVRVAAADGLMSLQTDDAKATKALQGLLEDPDLRIRWRCAAALIGAGHPPAPLMPELARGIDSPDDMDRVECFAAIERLGKLAAPLRNKITPWRTFPAALVSSAAMRASVATRTGDKKNVEAD